MLIPLAIRTVLWNVHVLELLAFYRIYTHLDRQTVRQIDRQIQWQYFVPHLLRWRTLFL